MKRTLIALALASGLSAALIEASPAQFPGGWVQDCHTCSNHIPAPEGTIHVIDTFDTLEELHEAVANGAGGAEDWWNFILVEFLWGFECDLCPDGQPCEMEIDDSHTEDDAAAAVRQVGNKFELVYVVESSFWAWVCCGPCGGSF